MLNESTVVKCMTFTIIAFDKDDCMFGVASASKVVAVGMYVPYIRENVGAIASQAYVSPVIGHKGLELLESGKSVDEIGEYFIKVDSDIELRQFAIIDRHGKAFVSTGKEVDSFAGHLVGDSFVVLGNALKDKSVLECMYREFLNSKKRCLSFDEQLISSIQAGECAGGDGRGKQSACLKIYKDKEAPLFDLRVDDHKYPIDELRRIVKIYKEEMLDVWDLLPAKDDIKGSLRKIKKQHENK